MLFLRKGGDSTIGVLKNLKRRPIMMFYRVSNLGQNLLFSCCLLSSISYIFDG